MARAVRPSVSVPAHEPENAAPRLDARNVDRVADALDRLIDAVQMRVNGAQNTVSAKPESVRAA